MSNNFERSFDIVMSFEGGYVSPEAAAAAGDPGGETKYGISKKAHPELDIKNLTLEKAKEIAKINYWDKARCDVMPWPICFLVFNFAYLCGVKRAIMILQKSLGITEDGIVGRATVAELVKANMVDNKPVIAIRYITNMYKFLKSLKAWDKFKNGWMSRLIMSLDKCGF